MKNGIKFLTFVVIAFFVARYINQRIAVYDMRFYSGKDGGYAIRAESICILSAFYFALMTDRNRLINGLIGLAIGFVITILSYFIVMATIPDPIAGDAYYFISCILFILTFIISEKVRKVKSNHS